MLYGILTFLNTRFFANISELTEEANTANEKMKFLTAFIKDVKTSNDITVLDYNKNSVRLSNNAVYEIRQVDNTNSSTPRYAVYRNDVKIASNIVPASINGVDSPYFDYNQNMNTISYCLQFADNKGNDNTALNRADGSVLVGRARGDSSDISSLDYADVQGTCVIKYLSNTSQAQETTQYKSKKNSVMLLDEDRSSFIAPVGMYLIGWSLTGGDNNTVDYEIGEEYAGEDITLYAVWKTLTTAKYLPGQQFNVAIKKLAGDTSNQYSRVNTTIRKIEWSDEEPGSENKNPGNIVSDNSSDEHIYAWIDGTTLKLWSNAKRILLNENSSSMFEAFQGITYLDVTKLLNVSLTTNVTNMSSMFKNCSGLTNLEVSKLNTRNVTSMESMFEGCSKIPSVNVSTFDTSNVTTMKKMFSGCKDMGSVDLTHFQTSGVTNMESMFESCSSLSRINLQSFNTANVTTMESMFYGCASANNIDIAGFDLMSTTTTKAMFSGCKEL